MTHHEEFEYLIVVCCSQNFPPGNGETIFYLKREGIKEWVRELKEVYWKPNPLKGVGHEIFYLPFFFLIRTHLGPMKYFRIWFWFRRDIRSQSCLRGVHPSAEMISAVCIPLRSATYRRDHLRGVQHTAEIISAVCITPRRLSLCTPQKRSQRWATHRGDDLRGVHHTAEILHTAETKSKFSLAFGCF